MPKPYEIDAHVLERIINEARRMTAPEAAAFMRALDTQLAAGYLAGPHAGLAAGMAAGIARGLIATGRPAPASAAPIRCDLCPEPAVSADAYTALCARHKAGPINAQTAPSADFPHEARA